MSRLSEIVKTRLELRHSEELAELAERKGLTPAALVRIYVLEGLRQERDAEGGSRRV